MQCDLNSIFNDMKPAQAKEIIKGKVETLAAMADAIDGNFDVDTISRFRQEFKIVRAFMTFIRLQRNDNKLKVPENCKYIYHLSGKIKELIDEKEHITGVGDKKELADLLLKTQKDWKRNYTKHIFPKFNDKISAIDFSKLNPDLLDNFFNNIAKESVGSAHKND